MYLHEVALLQSIRAKSNVSLVVQKVVEGKKMSIRLTCVFVKMSIPIYRKFYKLRGFCSSHYLELHLRIIRVSSEKNWTGPEICY